MNVKLLKKKLSVGLKGKEPILDGELCKDIKMEDSTWTVGLFWVPLDLLTTVKPSRRIEDQELVHIHLEKVNNQEWWENVLTHHPKIDTTKIVPENSKLSDLDGETRCVHPRRWVPAW